MCSDYVKLEHVFVLSLVICRSVRWFVDRNDDDDDDGIDLIILHSKILAKWKQGCHENMALKITIAH